LNWLIDDNTAGATIVDAKAKVIDAKPVE